MTTQNWPDPTRVGFPMFPDQDGKHVFEIELYPGFVVWEWSAKNKEYGGISYEAEIVYSPEEMAREYKYFGPALTSTQINEMLAAERERCADIADAKRDAVWDGKIGSLAKDKLRTGYAQAAITIADAIRNLGAAP